MVLHPPTDAHEVWVSVSAAPMFADVGPLLGAVCSFTDITPVHELEQRQEELLHIVSHDLRTPLSVIQGYSRILQDEQRMRGINDGLAEHATTIVRNVQRMNMMIQDLVDMARMEGQQFAVILRTIRLQSYLPDFLQGLEKVFPTHRVTLQVPAGLSPVRADENRLERILLHVLTNAFKYSAE
jgi:K+-sensing histidine kinase KdpD